jgi:hypothetical protein
VRAGARDVGGLIIRLVAFSVNRLPLPPPHQVGLVVVGLAVRSAGRIRDALAAATTTTGPAAAAAAAAAARAGSAASATLVTDRDMALGVALIALSALGYSLLGCLYEWLSAVRGPAMSHAQASRSGLTACVHCVLCAEPQVACTLGKRCLGSFSPI